MSIDQTFTIVKCVEGWWSSWNDKMCAACEEKNNLRTMAQPLCLCGHNHNHHHHHQRWWIITKVLYISSSITDNWMQTYRLEIDKSSGCLASSAISHPSRWLIAGRVLHCLPPSCWSPQLKSKKVLRSLLAKKKKKKKKITIIIECTIIIKHVPGTHSLWKYPRRDKIKVEHTHTHTYN